VQNEAHSIDFGGGFDGQYLEAELSADLAACAYRKSNPGILVCNPPRIGRQIMRATVSAARQLGASLFNDK